MSSSLLPDFADYSALCSAFDSRLALDASHVSYLKNFGYLGSNVVVEGPDKLCESALISLQENYDIRPTGILDADTMAVMRRPRCGVKDIVNGVNSMRRRPHTYGFDIAGACCYVLLPGCPKWPKFELSYVFESSIPQVAKLPIQLAFQKWSEVTDFVFLEKLGKLGDITIGMYSGEHGCDKYPFDGRYGLVLAHASGPQDGRLHFNADKLWSYDSHYGGSDELIDLHGVALHEIGHILGLGHSRDEGAIMYPTYNHSQLKRYLAPDDIDGIISLYGSVSASGYE